MSEESSEVGCRSCGKGGSWRIFIDERRRFVATHQCGHSVIISEGALVSKKDEEVYDMRMFV